MTINNTFAGADDVVEITTLANANLGSLTFTGNGNSTVGTLDGLSGKVLTLANTGTGTVSVGNIGTTGLSGGKLEVDTVKINVGLAPGESINVGGRTVTNTLRNATLTATRCGCLVWWCSCYWFDSWRYAHRLYCWSDRDRYGHLYLQSPQRNGYHLFRYGASCTC